MVEQKQLQLDIHSVLEDELGWLINYNPSENPEGREVDNILLAGHLRLIKTLLTCEGINKEDYGMCTYSLYLSGLDLMLDAQSFAQLVKLRQMCNASLKLAVEMCKGFDFQYKPHFTTIVSAI